jgi:hypothetical protein
LCVSIRVRINSVQLWFFMNYDNGKKNKTQNTQ